jgi:hypothetical protein
MTNTDMSDIFVKFCTIVNLEKNAIYQLNENEFYEIIYEHYNTMKDLCAISDEKTKLKNYRGLVISAKTQYNKILQESENNYIQYYLSLIKMFNDRIPLSDPNLCNYMKSLFISFSSVGRITSRYLKLPDDWMQIGYFGGLLEDLVVVMRTITQLKISSGQLISINEFIANFRNLIKNDQQNAFRFTFLVDLFTIDNNIKIGEFLLKAISLQGLSTRIGVYNDDINLYIYAIQGIFSCSYDNRVVKYLTPENTIPYAIHFTKIEIANAIWNNIPTTSTKNSSEIQVGEICRFNRCIHAISSVIKTDMGFKIGSSLKNLRNRMSHGIKPSGDGRKKYESGLIIDVVKLVSILPPKSVMINELGTLLVDKNIPHDCIIDCIDTDEKLDYFWG